MTTVTIRKEFKKDELFEFSCDSYYVSMIPGVAKATWNRAKTALKITEHYTNHTYIVTERHLAEALSQLILENACHCGEPITLNTDNWDSCVAIMLLETVSNWTRKGE